MSIEESLSMEPAPQGHPVPGGHLYVQTNEIRNAVIHYQRAEDELHAVDGAHEDGGFDVIVCGAGSGGSTVAGRLAEDASLSVLLLEAGPDDQRDSVLDPQLWVTNLGSDMTWNFVAEPSEELGGRAVPYFMGRGLGGGGSVNVTVWARGHRADWDSYARTTADEAWDYEHILNVYRRVEAYRGQSDPRRRGTEGPMWIEQLSSAHPFLAAVERAANNAGIPSVNSLNGEVMEQDSGTAFRDADVHDGRRQSPYRSYVYPKREQPNVTVLTGATVSRVLFDDRRARGVLLTDGRSFTANKQVILSLGAVNTPAVLLRSGIGDRQELQRLGISVVQHLPGVGRNLHDHVMVPLIWQAADGADLPAPLVAVNGIYWNLDDPHGHAVALYVDALAVPSETSAERRTIPDRAVTFLTGIRLRSRGRVTLTSDADDAAPVIEHGYYTDPKDLPEVAEILRTATKIGDSDELRPFLSRRAFPDADADDAAFLDYIREATSTFWHQSGTAAMGNDEASVVDSRLRVHGVDALRIADTSILPHVTVANTMAPAVVIGEQCAQFTQDDLIEGL